jgi:hypothetical protein
MNTKIIIKRLFIMLFAGCLLCGNLFAQTEACTKAINDGIALFNSGKYAEAKMKFEAAKRINCNDAQSWISKCNAKLNPPANPSKLPESSTEDMLYLQQTEQIRQDSIRQAQEEQKRTEQIARQEAELVIVDLSFTATTTDKKKKMNKDSWINVSDIVVKEDGREVGRLSSKINREPIKDRKISNTYAHVIKFKPDAKIISIDFKVSYNIERNSSSPLSMFKDHVNTQDNSKYIEFRFNETRQEWEVSYLDKQANPNDMPFKYFIIKDNIGFQDIDFRLNYVIRTKNKIY